LILSFNPFPLARMVFEQLAAYIGYYIEKRDVQVIVFALLFCLLGLPLAVLLDIARLPPKIYDRGLVNHPRHQLVEVRSPPHDANN
jgi:hypothetical protein